MTIALSSLVLTVMLTATGSPFDGAPQARRAAAEYAWPQETVIEPGYGCVVCHIEKRRAFLLGVHSERGIRCHDCHGGNPAALDVKSAHSSPDYIGAPDKFKTIELCSSCHSNPDMMRQYGLHVGQLAEYRSSQHGQRLLGERDTDAPTCSDCHDSHTILPPGDARSRVYPTNIVETCARCHADPELTAKHGLPDDEVELYRQSAHGVALFVEQNFAAPTCTGCHGSHGALPPAVTEISNVCGRCHVLVRRAFYAGPHGAAAREGRIPGCTACHSNHGTEVVPPDRIAATCLGCHEENSRAVTVGEQIQKGVLRATQELRSADEAIEELVRAGRRVSGLRLRDKAAHTAYLQIAQAQHSLDLEALERLNLDIESISRDIRGAAETAAEQRWEHKLILIPVWFLALSAIVLAGFKLRELAARRER